MGGAVPKLLSGLGIGCIVFIAVDWVAALWLDEVIRTSRPLLSLVMVGGLAAATVVCAAARPLVGLSAAATMFGIIGIGIALGGVGYVGESAGGLLLTEPLAVIRRGAHQATVVAVAGSLLAAAAVALRHDRQRSSNLQ